MRIELIMIMKCNISTQPIGHRREGKIYYTYISTAFVTKHSTIYPSCPVTDEELESNEPVWKRALMFSIRNLILIALICLYLYAGALLFRFLEVENSKNECVIVRLIVSLVSHNDPAAL